MARFEGDFGAILWVNEMGVIDGQTGEWLKILLAATGPANSLVFPYSAKFIWL